MYRPRPQRERIGKDRLGAIASQGRGLANMQARASALGGQLSLNSQPGRGTSVRLWLPLQQDARPTANCRAG